MSNLPPLPGHPEPHTYCWTNEEIAAIKEYGQQCRDAALDEAAALCEQLAAQHTLATGEYDHARVRLAVAIRKLK